jgi:hypothetical protein
MVDNKDKPAGAKQGKPKLPPTGVLIMLSLVFPGAGQLANGQKAKGWVIVSISAVLFIFFFIQLSSIIPPVYRAMSSGAEPVIDATYIGKVYNILMILFAAVVVWLFAIVDAAIVGGRKFREGAKP